MEQKGFDFNFFIGFMLIGFLLLLMIPSSPEEPMPILGCTDEKAINYNPEANKENDSCKYNQDVKNIELEIEKKEPSQVLNLDAQNKVKILDTISILKNNELEIQFSNKCGCFKDVQFIQKSKNQDTFKHQSFQSTDKDQVPIKFISKENTSVSPINLVTRTKSENKFESGNDYFELKEKNDSTIIYKHPTENYSLEYTLSNNKLNFKILGKTNTLNFYWEVSAPRQEKNLESGFTSERNSSYLVYSTNKGKYKKMSFSGNEKIENEEDPVSWIGYKQQFFSTILSSSSSNSGFIVNYMKIVGEDLDSTVVKKMESKIKLDNNNSFSFLFVPNDYNFLKNLDSPKGSAGFENLVELGWGIFGWVNQFLVIPIFDFLQNQGLGYGLIILVIAIVFKMLLYLPTKKSYVSMAKMRVLKPEIDAINEQYKDKDPMEKQKAQMDLYKRTGVSPLGGCLPMLLQIPILFALFKFFPSSIQLRQQSFLWADDLSTYDSVWEFSLWPGIFDHLSLFALLMSISTLVQMRFNTQPTNSQMPQLKYMMYIMPVVFFFIMNNYSAGLSYYYLLANIITFLQQLYIKRSLDEKKMYAQLQANKNRPIKKSNFQKKLEEIAKKQKQKRRR